MKNKIEILIQLGLNMQPAFSHTSKTEKYKTFQQNFYKQAFMVLQQKFEETQNVFNIKIFVPGILLVTTLVLSVLPYRIQH